MYWAEALSNQDDDTELKSIFKDLFSKIHKNMNIILSQISDSQGNNQDIKGYYFPK